MRHGVFQSDPILEMLLSYYSSSGIKENPPTEDPGPGNQPLGILALVTAVVSHHTMSPSTTVLTLSLGQVERVYKMYTTGDFIKSGQRFDAELCGPRTA